MCPADPFEETRRAIRGEVTVDERLCASRPTSAPPGAPSDSPLAAALDAVERGLDGDDSVLVTPPYRIVRKWPGKKRRARQKKKTTRPITPVYEALHVEEIALPYHPLVDDRTGDSGIDRSLPNGDRDRD